MRHTILLLISISRIAAADPNTAKADALFKQGRAAMAAGQFGSACEAFDASQKLAPATTTLFNQADCREKNGQLATAWRLFGEAERATRGAVDEVGKRLHKVAVERAGELEPRLSHLTIKVAANVDGIVLRRDDTAVPAADWNRAMPIDAGTYTFTARRGDRDVWSETVSVAIASDDVSVDVVPGRQDDPAARPAPAAAASQGELHATTATTSSSKLGAKIATAGSLALLGGALGFDLWGDSTYNSAKQMNSIDLWNSANNERYVAEGMLAAGVACAGVAVFLWLHDSESPKHVVAPMVGAGTAGVALSGSW